MLQTIVTQGWRRFVQAAMGLGVATLVACGGGGGSAGDTVFPGGGTGGSSGTPTAGDLVMTLSSPALPSDGTGSALVTVYAVDANRNTLANVPVSISVDANALVSSSDTKTDASGVVTGTVRIGSDQSLRTITIKAVSGSITKTAQINVVTPSSTGTTTGPVLTVGLSTTQITPAVTANVTVQLKSAAGTPMSDVVVSLATGRGNLADLSVTTVRTDTNGQATAQLRASSSGTTGADYVTAVAAIGSATVNAQQAFTVTNALPTLTVSPASVTLRLSQGPQAVTATVRDAAGQPVALQNLSFASVNGVVAPTPSDVVTSVAGTASSTLALAGTAGTLSTTDTVRVTGTYQPSSGGTPTQLSANVSVQVVGESPTATMTLSNSNVTAGSSTRANVLVRDVSGNPVSGQIVQFTSQFGLVKFDASTSLTNTQGIASVAIIPVDAAANGADVVRASATVAGIAATDSKTVQVVSATSPGVPVLRLSLSSTSVSAAVPATVTATLTDSRGVAVAGQVVTFSVVRALGRTNVSTALTDTTGRAVVLLSPASSSSAGADEITATARYAGTDLSASQGFQVQATNATIVSFTGPASMSAYGQDTLTITLTGAAVDSPVKLSVSSSCAAAGKATVSPATVSATSNTVALQYRDNGCGAVQPSDLLQVVIDGTSTARQLTLPIAAPSAVSLAFISATPEQIFLKGSGFTESSIVTFEVRDAAGNPLPNRVVELRLQTGAGGVTMEGRAVESVDPPSADPFTQTSNALGRVSVRVNSGTQPTPVRIHAKLQGQTIATVSSNLSVGIGLPSQLNFSMSQQTINIEGYNVDNVPNTYTLIAADRSGNPVPVGTAINFVAEGGQVEFTKQIQQLSGISQATSNFVSAQPKPVDGRVTVVAYALGEESFIDKNGNNTYDTGEEFQDLGNIFKDRNYDGLFDSTLDEFIGVNLSGNTSTACVPPTTVAIFGLTAYTPSVPATCDGKWTGSGQIYVRRAVETVLSTSAARPLWAGDDSRVSYANSTLPMQTGPSTAQVANLHEAGGDTICNAGTSGSFRLLAADANPGLLTSPSADRSLQASYIVLPRFNPMPAGTTVSVSTPTTGFAATLASGSPIPNTSQVTPVDVGYSFDTAGTGSITVTFTSPRGTGTSFNFKVSRVTPCP